MWLIYLKKFDMDLDEVLDMHRSGNLKQISPYRGARIWSNGQRLFVSSNRRVGIKAASVYGISADIWKLKQNDLEMLQQLSRALYEQKVQA